VAENEKGVGKKEIAGVEKREKKETTRKEEKGRDKSGVKRRR